jgi:O-acetyl-ADP-ribose deacetylase (regulator of RNase III)
VRGVRVAPGPLVVHPGGARPALPSVRHPPRDRLPVSAVRVVVGDITRLDEVGVAADAIVNAANSRLLGGSGVCGAIFAAAGPSEMSAACAAIGGCPTGSAVATPAFGLAARGVDHVIHAVGPVYGSTSPDEADRLLAATYRAALDVAEELGAERVALPAISTGVYGFPERRAAFIAAHETTAHQGDLVEVVLVAFDLASAAVLEEALAGVADG